MLYTDCLLGYARPLEYIHFHCKRFIEYVFVQDTDYYDSYDGDCGDDDDDAHFIPKIPIDIL